MPHDSLKRFVLLAGVDFYHNDNSRKDVYGGSISPRHLNGCVNDVEAMSHYLANKYHLHRCLKLTCKAGDTKREVWPTFKNIKKEFKVVGADAKKGDLFLFYFSGHGSLLPQTATSPAGRSTDPSLLTADYYCGKPPIRGYQLNSWLKRLTDKQVQVVVILDSCHSGGSWKADGEVRCQDLSNSIVLPADEQATAEEFAGEENYRNAELGWNWNINPQRLSLMVACAENKLAAENQFNGAIYGAFTFSLLQHLERNRIDDVRVTYRCILDSIAPILQPQVPAVYGREKLLFFSGKEPLCTVPVPTHIESGEIVIPVGKFHGIKEKSEFRALSLKSNVDFSIYHVDDFTSKAWIHASHEISTLDSGPMVVMSRLGCGTDVSHVAIYSDCEEGFQEELAETLKIRIVEFELLGYKPSIDTDQLLFSIGRNSDGDTVLHGPQALLGYRGPVRGLKFEGNISEQALQITEAIFHLCRFNQILRVTSDLSYAPEPFEVWQVEPASEGSPITSGGKVAFELKNTSNFDFYVAIFNFGPGFSVTQILSADDDRANVSAGSSLKVPLKMSIPDKLSNHRFKHRDIIRFVVCDAKHDCLKRGIELPKIWDANRNLFAGPLDWRDATVQWGMKWWLRDVVLTVIP